MTSVLMRTPLLSISLALAVGPLAGPATGVTDLAAQGTLHSSRRTPVTVALVDVLPLDPMRYVAAIVRTPGGVGRDVILLPRATATGLLLDQATRTLLHVRTSTGGHPSAYRGRSFRALTIGVRPRTSSARRDQRAVGLAQHVVDRLKAADVPVQDLPGIGRVPALEFIPPAAPTRSLAPGS